MFVCGKDCGERVDSSFVAGKNGSIFCGRIRSVGRRNSGTGSNGGTTCLIIQLLTSRLITEPCAWIVSLFCDNSKGGRKLLDFLRRRNLSSSATADDRVIQLLTRA